jgi:hypothetical protein
VPSLRDSPLQVIIFSFPNELQNFVIGNEVKQSKNYQPNDATEEDNKVRQ